MLQNVIEIENAVRQLPPADLADFRRWFLEFDAQLWDEEMERDAAEGRLDALADEALAEHRAGRSTPL